MCVLACNTLLTIVLLLVLSVPDNAQLDWFLLPICHVCTAVLGDFHFDAMAHCLHGMVSRGGEGRGSNPIWWSDVSITNLGRTHTLGILTPWTLPRMHCRHCRQRFGPMLQNNIPLEVAARAPRAHVDPYSYTHPALHPQALGWHPDLHLVWGGIGIWGTL